MFMVQPVYGSEQVPYPFWGEKDEDYISLSLEVVLIN